MRPRTATRRGGRQLQPLVARRVAADPLGDRHDQLDDIVATTTQAFLGLTLACARCHNHKFEPLTLHDYYRMVAVFNPLERPRDIAEELSKPGEGYYFDDDFKSLKIRVERAYSKIAWAEVPPSRTRHLITNVRIKKGEGAEVQVRSSFLVYRTRMETDQDIFVGERHDLLRRAGGSFKIARRTIILDQAVLTAKNISVFL